MLRSAKIKQYLLYMKAQGIDETAVLANTRIGEKELSDPLLVFELQQCNQIIYNILKLTQNHHIGFEFGAGCQLPDLGIIGYAISSSANLRQAIELFFEYASSWSGIPISAIIHENQDKSWGVFFESFLVDSEIFRFYVEEIVGMGVSLTPLITGGEKLDISRLTLTTGVPDLDASLVKTVAFPVYTGSDRNEISVARPSLDSHLVGNDERVNELCLLHCDNLLRSVGRRGSTISLVRSLFIKHHGDLTLEEAANHLCISGRSLRRHLHEEGATYQQLLNEFRNDLAREYLNTGIMQVKEIAFRLGFSRPDAFSRAFRTWNGMTISEYRTGLSRPDTTRPTLRDHKKPA